MVCVFKKPSDGKMRERQFKNQGIYLILQLGCTCEVQVAFYLLKLSQQSRIHLNTMFNKK